MNNWLKEKGIHLIIIGVFITATFTYFSPVLQGKVPYQHDVLQAKAMGKEIMDYRALDGKAPLWTNQMFGGMPAYQIWTYYPGNITTYIIQGWNKLFPSPTNIILLFLLGAYLLFNVLKLRPWLAAAAAFAVTFSSYNFIIIEAGHNNKALAIAFFAPILAGILLTLRGKNWLGASITALALSLEIRANHLQMAYYLMLSILILMVVELIKSLKSKQLRPYLNSCIYLFVAVVISLEVNIAMLWSNYEYGERSIRGKANIVTAKSNPESGLDREYAFQWSHGIKESMTFLVPNFYGGASQENLSQKSAVAEAMQSNGVEEWQQYLKGMPTYWGEQPFTSGPVYFGAIVVFLFVLGTILSKSRFKWWLIGSTILSLILSWGKNFDIISNLFFDYFPLYNKFRAVSSILVVAGLCIPILAFIVLDEISTFFDTNAEEKRKVFKKIKIVFLSVGSLLLLMAILPSLWGDFSSDADQEMPEWLRSALRSDRQGMLRADAFRSLVLISIAFGLLWANFKSKISTQTLQITIMVLVIFDLWQVDKRYLNNEIFVRKSEIEQQAFPLRAVDEYLLQDKDPNFRVLDLTIPTFSSANTSYYFKTVGGYHAAKLRRFQELVDEHFSKGINDKVVDMLNTKYVIFNADSTGEQATFQQNDKACGNAWFVERVVYANTDLEELKTLHKFDPRNDVVVNRSFQSSINQKTLSFDPNAFIRMTNYHPDHISYEYSSGKEVMAVFSEIYYDKGWNMYIDENPSPYIRADYVLRAAQLPAGNHKIEFRFEPRSYYIGDNISLAASLLLVVGLGASTFVELRKKKDEKEV